MHNLLVRWSKLGWRVYRVLHERLPNNTNFKLWACDMSNLNMLVSIMLNKTFGGDI